SADSSDPVQAACACSLRSLSVELAELSSPPPPQPASATTARPSTANHVACLIRCPFQDPRRGSIEAATRRRRPLRRPTRLALPAPPPAGRGGPDRASS